MKKRIGLITLIAVILIILVTATILVFIRNNVTGKSSEENSGHSEITKITDYLYEISYTDYANGFKNSQAYFQKYMPNLGGCSSVQNGYIRGRNYDWTYDEAPEFVIHVSASEGRHASVGITSLTSFTASDIDNKKDLSSYYDVLPYSTLDGINDSGVTININVVNYGEKGSYVMKTEDASDDVFPGMIVRLVLDKASNVEEAIDIIKNMDIYSIGTAEEAHYMISGPKSSTDSTYTTVVAELIPDENKHYQVNVVGKDGNEFVNNKPIMTNFHLTEFDGTVASLEKHPMGYERYLILSESYNQGSTISGMKQLMKKVYYTNFYDLYSDKYWYSENTGGELTLDKAGADRLNGDISKAGEFATIVESGHKNYEAGLRNGTTWHTVHTSVYDGKNLTLSVIPQEGGFSYDFKLTK